MSLGLGLGLGLARGDNFAAARATLAAWKARVIAGGHTVDASYDSARISFLASCIRAGFTDANARINAFDGDALGGALYPYFRGGGPDAETNVNFVSGDYARATGLQGNGTTKYLDTGVVPSAPTGHMGTYLRTHTAPASNINHMGARDAGLTQIYRIINTTGSPQVCLGGSGGTVASLNPRATRLNMGVRRSSTDLAAYRDGSLTASATTATTASPIAFSTFIFAQNAAGSPAGFTADAAGGYSFGAPAPDAAAALALAQAWQALMTAFGRNV